MAAISLPRSGEEYVLRGAFNYAAANGFILFITDQQRADFPGCYGHPVLKTPNIDAIAADGVAFDRFYVASPVCMPNRAGLMTGRMPSGHGVRSNGIPLSRRNVTFVELLRDAGYDTALIGKSHLQNFTDFAPVVGRRAARSSFHCWQGELARSVRHDLGDGFYPRKNPLTGPKKARASPRRFTALSMWSWCAAMATRWAAIIPHGCWSARPMPPNWWGRKTNCRMIVSARRRSEPRFRRSSTPPPISPSGRRHGSTKGPMRKSRSS